MVGWEGRLKQKKKKEPHELGHVLHGTVAPASGSARTPQGPAVHMPEIAATFCVKELFTLFNIFSVFFLGTTIKRAVLHSHIPDCTAAVSTLRRAATVPRAEAHARAKPDWGAREDAAPTAVSLLGTRRGGMGTPNPQGTSVSLQTVSRHCPTLPNPSSPFFTQTQQNDKKRATGWNHQARGCAGETQQKRTQEVASEPTPPAPWGQAKNTSFGKDNAQQEAGRDTTAPPPLHHQCWAHGWCTPAMPSPVPPKSIKAHEVTKKRGNFK